MYICSHIIYNTVSLTCQGSILYILWYWCWFDAAYHMRSSILCYDLLDLMTYHKLQIDHLVPIAGFQDFEKILDQSIHIKIAAHNHGFERFASRSRFHGSDKSLRLVILLISFLYKSTNLKPGSSDWSPKAPIHSLYMLQWPTYIYIYMYM